MSWCLSELTVMVDGLIRKCAERAFGQMIVFCVTLP